MKRLTICALVACQLAGSAVAQEASPPERPAEAPLDASGKQTVESINGFTVDLYKRSIAPGANLFLSPANVSTAIALAYRGARGTTAEELSAVMHYGRAPASYLAESGPVMRSLSRSSEGRELRVSNALWVQEDLPLRPDFVADLSAHMAAGLQRADFREDPEATRIAINRSVEAATNNRIKELLHEDDISDRTRMALINSIYWKGQWVTPFVAALTRAEPFRRLDGKPVETQLMHLQSNFRAIEREGVKAIEIPYAGHDVSMVVLLPNAASGLPRLERGLTADGLKRWLDDLDSSGGRDTILALPRMHLEWRDDLVPALKALGATTAFGDAADFTGMAKAPFPGEGAEVAGLKIGKVIHQTYLDVDETGSEAAAATAVLMDVIVSGLRKRSPPPPPFIFRADKPFLFLLRDHRTGLILFIGRYVAPPLAE